MPAYQYNGEPGRYYPSLAITPVPGEHFIFPGDPGDGRWSEVPTSDGATQPPVDLAETDPTLGQAIEPAADDATPPATTTNDAPPAQEASN